MIEALTRRLALPARVFRYVQKRGLSRTAQIAAHELWYAWRFGVGTSAVIHADRLDLPEEARGHSTPYFPSSYLFMKEAFAAAIGPQGADTFIDFGCGMGRALLFASQLPLRRLIGVELSPTLAEAARRNLSRYYRRRGKTTPTWEVVVADARQFEIPPEADVFYFFNPFDDAVLDRVAARIARSVAEHPRHVTILYLNPIHPEAILRHGFEERLRRTECRIFVGGPPSLR